MKENIFSLQKAAGSIAHCLVKTLDILLTLLQTPPPPQMIITLILLRNRLFWKMPWMMYMAVPPGSYLCNGVAPKQQTYIAFHGHIMSYLYWLLQYMLYILAYRSQTTNPIYFGGLHFNH